MPARVTLVECTNAAGLTPRGNETVLYTFCAQYNCTDGEEPFSALVFDRQGNLYGTTVAGGAYDDDRGQSGVVVFKLTPWSPRSVKAQALMARQ